MPGRVSAWVLPWCSRPLCPGSSTPQSQSSPKIRSLAVLPLENLSGDTSQDYFADGMTDALIADLGQISALRVISRTSAMAYKRVHRPLSEIARELNVEAVVEGTVLRSGDRVRITAQLIQVPNERHLWAKSYEGDLQDSIALQNSVARAIARADPGDTESAGRGCAEKIAARERRSL